MSNATQATKAPFNGLVSFWNISPRTVMAAFLPAYLGTGLAPPTSPLHELGGMAMVVWAASLIAGSLIAQDSILRWFGYSWIVALLFPVMPMLLLVASGALVNKWQDCLCAALLGLLIFPLAGLLPANANGVMLIACAFLLAISMGRS